MTIVQVQFVIDDRAKGDEIAEALLRDRLVACCQTIGPITSRYWWKAELEQATEWLFLAKATQERLTDIVERIKVMHPYETPEIVAYEITGGLGDYISWIANETATERLRP